MGLAINQLLCLSSFLCCGSITSADAEHQLMAVERLREYSQLPEEDEKKVDKKKPREISQKWPTTGFLEFRNVSMWYTKEEDMVLKNLNFVIKPSEKVGIHRFFINQVMMVIVLNRDTPNTGGNSWKNGSRKIVFDRSLIQISGTGRFNRNRRNRYRFHTPANLEKPPVHHSSGPCPVLRYIAT